MSIIYIAIGAGVVSLIFALIQTLKILRQDEGNESVRSIGKAIQQGAVAVLAREYRFLAFFVLTVVIILAVFIDYDILDRVGTERSIPSTAIAYLVGAIGSALAGYIGMSIAVRANTRTVVKAQQGLNPALRIASVSYTHLRAHET